MWEEIKMDGSLYFKLRQLWMVLLLTANISLAAKQPNVVFIMADDMGWNDVSFHGSDQIQTPNIDALAYQGVILQHYYSEAICTPARSALLTGKYPIRNGMYGYPLYNSEDRGIPLNERLLPSYLQELGYATHLVGKWHVGMSRKEFLPTNRGYDTHYGMRGGFVDYYTYNKVESWPDGRLMFGLDLFDDDVPQTCEKRYIVDALTDRAVQIIQNHNTSQPLFLHVTHNAPHAGNAGGALQPPLNGTVGNQHIANSDRRLYSEVVASLDRSIGIIVQELSAKYLLDNTIIVFVSDNGAPTVGEYSNWGINLPFRGKKGSPWEGAVRVPAFIWHSTLKPKVWNGLMHITDWLPTLITAAGGNLRGDVDGLNQWDSIVRGGESPRVEVLVAVEDSATNTFAAYRAGDYKIVVGNVTGVSNGYYGAEFLPIRSPPPPYFPAVKSSSVARSLESIGFSLNSKEVEKMRRNTAVRQMDKVRDPKPCEPSPSRGCLFNVRRDPSESHNLWDQANKIAILLTSRLRSLWSMQRKRGPTDLDVEADPVNFNYVWTPWIGANDTYFESSLDKVLPNKSILDNRLNRRDGKNKNTLASEVDCESNEGVKNFLCLMRTAF